LTESSTNRECEYGAVRARQNDRPGLVLNRFLLVVGMLMDIFSAIVVAGLTTCIPEASTWSSRLEKPLTLEAEMPAPKSGETLGELMKQQDGGKEPSADETLKRAVEYEW